MDELVAAFQEVSLTAVSDALDRCGLHGTCLGISPVAFGCQAAGRAFTVKYHPVGVEKGTVGDFIDDVPKATLWCWTMQAVSIAPFGEIY